MMIAPKTMPQQYRHRGLVVFGHNAMGLHKHPAAHEHETLLYILLFSLSNTALGLATIVVRDASFSSPSNGSVPSLVAKMMWK